MTVTFTSICNTSYFNMSTCSLYNGNFPESDYPFNERSHLQEALLSVDRPGIPQQTASQNSEELKRTRNRLAQRKHRQRKLCANLVLTARRHTYITYALKSGKKEEEVGSSGDPRETRSRKLSAANNRAMSIHKVTQKGRPQTIDKEIKRYRTDSFAGQQES